MIIIKDAFIVGAGKVASAIAMLLTAKALTHYLNVEQFGEFTLGLTVCNFVTQMIMGPLGQGVGRYYPIAKQNNDVEEFWGGVKSLLIKSLIPTATIALVAVGLLSYVKADIALILVLAFVVFGYISGLNDIFSSMQNMAFNRWLSAKNSLIELYLRLIFIMLLGSMWIGSAEIGIASYILAGIVAVGFQIKDKKTIGLQGSVNSNIYGKNIQKLAMNAAFWGGFVWIYQMSDKWLLNTFSTTADVGRYALIYQLAYVPAIMISGVVNALVSPILYNNEGRDSLFLSKLIGWALLFLAIGILFYFYFGELVLKVIGGYDYINVAKYMPILFAAAVLYSIGDLFILKSMAEMKFNFVKNFKIIESLFGVLINAIGIYFYGIGGLVFSLLFYSVIHCFGFRLIKNNHK